MKKERIYEYTDKIAEAMLHKNAIKQVYEIQKIVREIWEESESQSFSRQMEEAWELHNYLDHNGLPEDPNRSVK